MTVTVTGVDSDDTLIDTAGIDSLAGGIGEDVYYVNNTGDAVTEAAGGGPTPWSPASTTPCRPTVEALYMIGAGLTGTGSGDADTLLSTGGANILVGLGGDDLYFVNNIGDAVIETAGGGIDTVVATVNYTLPARTSRRSTCSAPA